MYTRGKFGIEYTPPEPKPESSWLGRVLFLAAIAAVVLVTRAIWQRISAPTTERANDPSVETDLGRPGAREPSETNALRIAESMARERKTIPLPTADASRRPLKIRNLLLRLSEAEQKNDVEMAVSTIEQIRATPGAADLDDTLARKLGTLNMLRLFVLKSAQWTTRVTVKRGDLATRIAYEHGSTFASMAKLNDMSLDKLRIGQTVTVMNHPRFSLVISRRSRTADLSLNGKFFKRYDLMDRVTGADGSYELPERFRNFCAEQGVPFKLLDRAELEMLLPKGATAFIKEI